MKANILSLRLLYASCVRSLENNSHMSSYIGKGRMQMYFVIKPFSMFFGGRVNLFVIVAKGYCKIYKLMTIINYKNEEESSFYNQQIDTVVHG